MLHPEKPYYALLILLMAPLISFQIEECDKNFISSEIGTKKGNFTSPNYPEPYPKNMQCLYWFVAKADEKVWIKFLDFFFGGNMPECLHGYIDVYTQIESTEIDLIDQHLDRRLCGMDLLPDIISLHNIVVLGLYSDMHITEKGFLATYTFINSSKYNVGIPDSNKFCGYTIHGSLLPWGTIVSPTYPSVLPPNLDCYWKFLGKPGQRIKLNFTDVNIESGGAHCPYDHIRIYDGDSIHSLVIDTLCGQITGRIIYSSSRNLYITFGSKESQLMNKTGFSLDFAFESNIVNLDFITNPGYHILGTECDQQVLSLGETNGTIFSPMYPRLYKRNLECNYYLKGLRDRENLEKVIIYFEMFDIPDNSSKCTDASLAIFFKVKSQYKEHIPDAKFCNGNPPTTISSLGHILIIKFRSGSTLGRGFKIWYDFDTDFGIPGTPHPDKARCDFTFSSSSQKSGIFNSPRHPANFPLKSSCLYTFKALPQESIKLTFEHFLLPKRTVSEDEVAASNLTLDDLECSLDYVKIYNVWESGQVDLLGTFCGEKSPFPIESEPGISTIKVVFHSGSNETGEGFQCQYVFTPGTEAKSAQECSQNFTENAVSGIVKSPSYPYKYQVSLTCDWYIRVKPKHRVSLTLINFLLEGKMETGCSGAAIIVWKDDTSPPKFLCGPKPPPNQSEFTSTSNVMRLKFISSKRATGAKGFRAVWTEIMSDTTCERGFLCEKTKYCIDQSLKCNHLPNCGAEDNSDEKYCFSKRKKDPIIILLCGIVLVLTVLTVIGTIFYKKKRERNLSVKKYASNKYDTMSFKQLNTQYE